MLIWTICQHCCSKSSIRKARYGHINNTQQSLIESDASKSMRTRLFENCSAKHELDHFRHVLKIATVQLTGSYIPMLSLHKTRETGRKFISVKVKAHCTKCRAEFWLWSGSKPLNSHAKAKLLTVHIRRRLSRWLADWIAAAPVNNTFVSNCPVIHCRQTVNI